jgi:HK97 family phage portal protein
LNISQIRNLFSPKAVIDSSLDTTLSQWTTIITGSDTKSETATSQNALSFASVYASVQCVADDIGAMPLQAFKRTDEKRERVRDHAVDYVLTKRTNKNMSPFTWKKLVLTDLLTYGNHYSLIAFGSDGQVQELIPLNASATDVFQDSNTGKLFYRTTRNNETVDFLDYEIFHCKGMGDGIKGISPILTLKDNIESNASADKLNHSLVQNGGIPKGIIKLQGAVNEEAKQRVKAEWKRTNSGNAIAVLDNGMDYQGLASTIAEMEWLSGQKFNLEMISAVFKVPLHRINQLDRSTFNNIEHQSLEYYKNTLLPLARMIEEESNFKLFSDRELRQGYYVKFNFDAILRPDAITKATVQEINFRNGFKTLNEIRAENEDNAFPDELADKPMMTLNYDVLENFDKSNEAGTGNNTEPEPPSGAK